MEKVYRRNADDHEAAAFYALSLLAAEPEHDKTKANRKQAAAVLEKLEVGGVKLTAEAETSCGLLWLQLIDPLAWRSEQMLKASRRWSSRERR